MNFTCDHTRRTRIVAKTNSRELPTWCCRGPVKETLKDTILRYATYAIYRSGAFMKNVTKTG